MKLRELINKLEKLSHNGQFDDYEVMVFSGERVDGNDICEDIKNVWRDIYDSSNETYEYIQIEI